MPEIFRLYGFSFFFYCREHYPIHVHVEGNGGFARFDLEGRNFVLKEHFGIKAGDLRRIKEAVDVNKDVIIDFWKKIFESDDEDSENLVRR